MPKLTTLDEMLDRGTVDQISEEARQVNVGRTLLNVVAFLLIGLGRTVAHLVTAVVWVCIAVRTGYREVRPKDAGLVERARLSGR